jgi:N-acetylneuraminate synthase
MFIAEIGINHNGDLDLAKKMIDAAVKAGADVVKFQKRDLDVAIPEDQKYVIKDTPWGNMFYIEYKKKIEFEKEQYDEIERYCKEKNIKWTASVWDVNSLNFLLQYDVPFIKIPSAALTDVDLIKKAIESKKPIVLSVGMSTMDEIEKSVSLFDKDYPLTLLYCKSIYPTYDDDINLNGITTLKEKFNFEVGYSGHETDTMPTIMAVVLGAKMIERHITTDRNLWGSDQKFSLTESDFNEMVKRVNRVSTILGSKDIKLEKKELQAKSKLRSK